MSYLPVLDTIITLSPRLGLLGTVTGMIAAFGILTTSAAPLTARLQARARTEPELAVVIEADTDVLHGRVVDVMDAARLAGVGKLAIAVTPRETKR